jgi:DNA-binding NtrC family response regulator
MTPQPSGPEDFTTAGKKQHRVLVVDDEPLVRWSLASSLAAAGHEVVTAATPSEALALASTLPHPDVVLIDLRPEDTIGPALFEQIRRVEPDCRFFVLTTARRRLAPAMWQGIQVIEKPFDVAAVVSLVEKACEDT